MRFFASLVPLAAAVVSAAAVALGLVARQGAAARVFWLFVATFCTLGIQEWCQTPTGSSLHGRRWGPPRSVARVIPCTTVGRNQLHNAKNFRHGHATNLSRLCWCEARSWLTMENNCMMRSSK